MAFQFGTYSPGGEVTKAKKRYEDLEAPGAYTPSATVTAAQAALTGLQRPGEYSSPYAGKADSMLGQIEARKPFTYDVNTDALYQMYKNQYATAGRQAMQDTMGQAAAMTGGYGNSYAATAGNQAYQQYLGQLNAVVPQLYGLAYDRYQQEGQDLRDMYSLYTARENQDYDRYRTQVGDFLNERNYLAGRLDSERSWDYGQYRDAVGDYQTDRGFYAGRLDAERSWDYGQWQDAQERAYQNWQLVQAELAGYGSGSSGGSSSGGGSRRTSPGTVDTTKPTQNPQPQQQTPGTVKQTATDGGIPIGTDKALATRIASKVDQLDKEGALVLGIGNDGTITYAAPGDPHTATLRFKNGAWQEV